MAAGATPGSAPSPDHQGAWGPAGDLWTGLHARRRAATGGRRAVRRLVAATAAAHVRQLSKCGGVCAREADV